MLSMIETVAKLREAGHDDFAILNRLAQIVESDAPSNHSLTQMSVQLRDGFIKRPAPEYRVYFRDIAEKTVIRHQVVADYDAGIELFDRLSNDPRYDTVALYNMNQSDEVGKSPGVGCIASSGRDVDLLTGIEYDGDKK